MDAVWDLDFTETEPLDHWIAEEIAADGLDTFTRLYSALAPFAAGDQESREVTSPEQSRPLSLSLFHIRLALKLAKYSKTIQTIIALCAGMLQKEAIPKF